MNKPPDISQNTLTHVVGLESSVKVLAALSHAARLQIFQELSHAEPKGLSAGALAERVGLSPSNLTFHLKELKNAGLIHAEREGRFTHLRANIIFLSSVLEDVVGTCCGGNPEQCGLFD